MKKLILLLLITFSGFYCQSGSVKSSDETEIFYGVEGSGSIALVFVHGWSCDRSYWQNQIDQFKSDYTVVAVDLAGHGESGLTRQNYTMQLFGDDVAAVVNKLQLNKVILIGHSMGGSVVIEGAKRLKDKTIGVIGVDTYQSFEDDWSDEQKKNFLEPFKKDFVGTTKAFVRSMFPPAADSLLVKKIADDMSSAPKEVAVSAMENLFFYNAVNELKDFTFPIKSINCDMYPLAPEANRKYVKQFDLKIMKGVGHFLMLENPWQFNVLLKESINELINGK